MPTRNSCNSQSARGTRRADPVRLRSRTTPIWFDPVSVNRAFGVRPRTAHDGQSFGGGKARDNPGEAGVRERATEWLLAHQKLSYGTTPMSPGPRGSSRHGAAATRYRLIHCPSARFAHTDTCRGTAEPWLEAPRGDRIRTRADAIGKAPLQPSARRRPCLPTARGVNASSVRGRGCRTFGDPEGSTQVRSDGRPLRAYSEDRLSATGKDERPWRRTRFPPRRRWDRARSIAKGIVFSNALWFAVGACDLFGEDTRRESPPRVALAGDRDAFSARLAAHPRPHGSRRPFDSRRGLRRRRGIVAMASQAGNPWSVRSGSQHQGGNMPSESTAPNAPGQLACRKDVAARFLAPETGRPSCATVPSRDPPARTRNPRPAAS